MNTDIPKMGFPKLLLNIGLILVTTTIFCIADNSEIIPRLPNNARPVHYNISLIPHLKARNFKFSGKISVIIWIFYASQNISLHSRELEINKTATTLITFNSANIKPMEHIYNDASNILTLNFDHMLSYGFHTLNMEFIGISSLKNGFMTIPYAKNKDYTSAVTHFQPDAARRMFPCWDEPAFKATFNISVMHDQRYKVLSNMPVREIVEQDNMMWTHFKTTPVMSTYLVGILISDEFIHITNSDETIKVWFRSSLLTSPSVEEKMHNILFMRDVAENVTSLLIEYTNIPEKVPKMDHVIVPGFPVSGMENWGLIIYKESNVMNYNFTNSNSTYSVVKKREVALLIAHEIVHQWFGNLVTPVWWSYLWLSEGFAAFFEAYFINKLFGQWRIMDLLVVQQLHDSLSLDIGLLDSVTMKITNTFDENDIFKDEVYTKAPVILRMLHHAITDEVFQKGIVRYLAAYQFTSVTPDDLWRSMQGALDETLESIVPHEDYKIKEIMDTWINQDRYPVLNVTRNYETGEVTITQKCVRATEDINYQWWIPITFTTQGGVDFSNTVPRHWIGPNQTSSLEISSREWLIVNLQQTAYCRVYYDATNWQKIIHYLNSEEYINVHVLNRAQIIDDACAFVLENQINGSVFVNLINYLSRERDYVAWSPIFRILKKLTKSKYLSLPESEDFKAHMIKLFDKLLHHVGYEESLDDDDMTKMLRTDATIWACIIGHVECKRKAAVKLTEYLRDPDTEYYKIPPLWRLWMDKFGLRVANRTIWNKVLDLYKRKPTYYTQLWKVLSYAEDPGIIINYLNIIASNTTLFNYEKHPFIFNVILKNHARNDLILDYILKHFETIKPRSIATDLIIKNILRNVFSNKQIHKVKTFSETNFQQDQNLLLKIFDLIEMRTDNLKQLRDFFTKRFGRNQIHANWFN